MVIIGDEGTGTLTVSNRANLSTGGTVIVGNVGRGTLTIDQGSQITDTGAIVGATAGSNGFVTITMAHDSGAFSRWLNYGPLSIGNGGDGTLVIENSGGLGASVLSQSGTIGTGSGAIGSVIVSGGG